MADRIEEAAKNVTDAIVAWDVSDIRHIPAALFAIVDELREQAYRTTPTACANVIAAINAARTVPDVEDVLLGSRARIAGMTADERSRVATEYAMRLARVGRDGK